MTKDIVKTLLKAREADVRACRAVWAKAAKQTGEFKSSEALLAAMTKPQQREVIRQVAAVANKRFSGIVNSMDGRESAAAFKALRVILGFSVQDLAREWEVSPRRLYRWQAGHRKRIPLMDFAALLATVEIARERRGKTADR